jgi:hypothetical protein
MGNVSCPTDDRSTADSDSGGPLKPRGTSVNSSEQKVTAIGADRGTERDAGSESHLDGEAEAKADTLYNDGIDIEEDCDTPAGTHGSSGTIP